MKKEKKIVSRDQEISFTNWTGKEFVHTYDHGRFVARGRKQVWIPRRLIYKFKPKKSYYIPFYVAEVMAKHLADREYNRAFQKKLDEVLEKAGDQIDRRVIENRVKNSPEMRKVNLQEMKDKCVEVIPTKETVDRMEPEEAKMKEIVLNRDRRGVQLAEELGMSITSDAGTGGIQADVKAIKEEGDETAKTVDEINNPNLREELDEEEFEEEVKPKKKSETRK